MLGHGTYFINGVYTVTAKPPKKTGCAKVDALSFIEEYIMASSHPLRHGLVHNEGAVVFPVRHPQAVRRPPQLREVLQTQGVPIVRDAAHRQ